MADPGNLLALQQLRQLSGDTTVIADSSADVLTQRPLAWRKRLREA